MKQTEIITKDEEQQLWGSGVLGTNDPKYYRLLCLHTWRDISPSALKLTVSEATQPLHIYYIYNESSVRIEVALSDNCMSRAVCSIFLINTSANCHQKCYAMASKHIILYPHIENCHGQRVRCYACTGWAHARHMMHARVELMRGIWQCGRSKLNEHAHSMETPYLPWQLSAIQL